MILTIGPGGCGFTFLNWSIVYLRGDVSYTTINNTTVPVDINPLNGLIAHKFDKDHIHYSSNLYQLNLGNEQSVIYVTPANQDEFNRISQFNCKRIVFDCQGRSKDHFARILTCIPSEKLTELLESLSQTFGRDTAKQVMLDSSKWFTNYYSIPENQDLYVITYDDIFTNLDQRIHQLFVFLGLSINKDRFSSWADIYNTYRLRNQNLLTNFLPNHIDVARDVKLKIIREILLWRNGLFPHKCTR